MVAIFITLFILGCFSIYICCVAAGNSTRLEEKMNDEMKDIKS